MDRRKFLALGALAPIAIPGLIKGATELQCGDIVEVIDHPDYSLDRQIGMQGVVLHQSNHNYSQKSRGYKVYNVYWYDEKNELISDERLLKKVGEVSDKAKAELMPFTQEIGRMKKIIHKQHKKSYRKFDIGDKVKFIKIPTPERVQYKSYFGPWVGKEGEVVAESRHLNKNKKIHVEYTVIFDKVADEKQMWYSIPQDCLRRI